MRSVVRAFLVPLQILQEVRGIASRSDVEVVLDGDHEVAATGHDGPRDLIRVVAQLASEGEGEHSRMEDEANVLFGLPRSSWRLPGAFPASFPPLPPKLLRYNPIGVPGLPANAGRRMLDRVPSPLPLPTVSLGEPSPRNRDEGRPDSLTAGRRELHHGSCSPTTIANRRR
jgi:hypothetical protein